MTFPALTVGRTPHRALEDWTLRTQGAVEGPREWTREMIPTGEREPVGRRCLYLEEATVDDGCDAPAVPAEFEALPRALR